jgi:uncharacterized protein Yka (UPF0111/DUF47 family)
MRPHCHSVWKNLDLVLIERLVLRWMLMPEDLTVHILREIRDEIRQTNQRLDQTNQRLDQTREELGRRITESELRTATAITDLAGAVRDVRQLLQDRLDLRDRVERCEQDIDQIKRRLG